MQEHIHSARLITSIPRTQSSHSPEPGKLLRGPSRAALSTQDSPAKALEIRSFFHSQGWSYSSGGPLIILWQAGLPGPGGPLTLWGGPLLLWLIGCVIQRQGLSCCLLGAPDLCQGKAGGEV